MKVEEYAKELGLPLTTRVREKDEQGRGLKLTLLEDILEREMPEDEFWQSLFLPDKTTLWAKVTGQLVGHITPDLLKRYPSLEALGYPKEMSDLLRKYPHLRDNKIRYMVKAGWSKEWLEKALKLDDFPQSESFVEGHSKETIIRLFTERQLRDAEGRTVSSSYFLHDLQDEWQWLHENAPDVLKKRPRIRDTSGYYRWLRKERCRADDYDLPVDESLREVLGKSLSGYDLVWPERVADLRVWAEKLDQCVDTYGDRVRSKSCSLISFQKEGEPVFTLQVYPDRTMGQFLGHNNSEVPMELYKKVEERLKKEEVVEEEEVPKRKKFLFFF